MSSIGKCSDFDDILTTVAPCSALKTDWERKRAATLKYHVWQLEHSERASASPAACVKTAHMQIQSCHRRTHWRVRVTLLIHTQSHGHAHKHTHWKQWDKMSASAVSTAASKYEWSYTAPRSRMNNKRLKHFTPSSHCISACMWENDQLNQIHGFVSIDELANDRLCLCQRVCVGVRGLYRRQEAVTMLNEQIYCALCHLSISALVSPQIDKRRDICHHRDKVECGMTGISNLHNKQWNSNYQPAQTIFPAVTFGPQDCSIIHRHSRLRSKKKRRERKKIKRAWENEATEGLMY